MLNMTELFERAYEKTAKVTKDLVRSGDEKKIREHFTPIVELRESKEFNNLIKQAILIMNSGGASLQEALSDVLGQTLLIGLEMAEQKTEYIRTIPALTELEKLYTLSDTRREPQPEDNLYGS